MSSTRLAATPHCPPVSNDLSPAKLVGTVPLPRVARAAVWSSAATSPRAESQGPALRAALTRPEVHLRRGSGCCQKAHNHQAHSSVELHSEQVTEETDGDELPKCACGGGGLDLDELGGLAQALADGHDHHSWFCAPHGTVGITVGMITGHAALLGLYFGNMNRAHGGQMIEVLSQRSQQVGEQAQKAETRVKAVAAAPIADRMEWKNLRAQQEALGSGLSMQRFIHDWAGVAPMVTSALMLAGIFMPPAAVVATLSLMAYCAAHTVRYLRCDLPRARLPIRAAKHMDGSALADAGLQEAQRLQHERRRIIAAVAGCFGLYGIGAGGFLAGAVFGSAPLLWGAMVPFMAGMLAVTYLNNFSIRKAFINNQNTYLDRQHLGSQGSILRHLGSLAAERDVLQRCIREMTQGRKAKHFRLPWPKVWAHRLGIIFGYLWGGWLTGDLLNAWRHRQRIKCYEQAPVAVLLEMVQVASTSKSCQLREEAQALRARQARRPLDKEALESTAHVVSEWQAVEQEIGHQAHQAKQNGDDALALAAMWNFLATRDVLDDQLCAVGQRLMKSSSDAKPAGNWWGCSQGAPHGGIAVSLAAWQQALRLGDPEAAKQFGQLRGEMLHYLLHEYPAALTSRIGSLTDQLVSRSLIKGDV